MLRILHLSDPHLRAEDPPDRDRVLRALLRTLGEQTGAGRGLDLIVVSGDLVDRPDPAAYEVGGRFLEQLLLAGGVGRERLVLVPGNHDIDRGAGRRLQRAPVDAADAGQFFGDVAERALHDRKLTSYAAFYRGFFGRDPGFLMGQPGRVVEVAGGVRVGVAELCSVWFSQGDDDRERLWLGEAMVQGGLSGMEGAAVRMAVAHHGLMWLHPQDRSEVQAVLRGYDLYLHGHVHGMAPDAVMGVRSLGAGACHRSQVQPARAYLIECEVAGGASAARIASEVMTYQAAAERWGIGDSLDKPNELSVPGSKFTAEPGTPGDSLDKPNELSVPGSGSGHPAQAPSAPRGALSGSGHSAQVPSAPRGVPSGSGHSAQVPSAPRGVPSAPRGVSSAPRGVSQVAEPGDRSIPPVAAGSAVPPSAVPPSAVPQDPLAALPRYLAALVRAADAQELVFQHPLKGTPLLLSPFYHELPARVLPEGAAAAGQSAGQTVGVHRVVAENRRLVLVGPPGGGKSATASYLSGQLARQALGMPSAAGTFGFGRAEIPVPLWLGPAGLRAAVRRPADAASPASNPASPANNSASPAGHPASPASNPASPASNPASPATRPPGNLALIERLVAQARVLLNGLPASGALPAGAAADPGAADAGHSDDGLRAMFRALLSRAEGPPALLIVDPGPPSGVAPDREARAAVNDREARAAVNDREARAAVNDREARSAAVNDREARAAVNDREARAASLAEQIKAAVTALPAPRARVLWLREEGGKQPADYVVAALQPLGLSDREQFVDRWVQVVHEIPVGMTIDGSAAAVAMLLRRVATSLRTAPLSQHPLLLHGLCWASTLQGLPEQRAELYATCLGALCASRVRADPDGVGDLVDELAARNPALHGFRTAQALDERPDAWAAVRPLLGDPDSYEALRLLAGLQARRAPDLGTRLLRGLLSEAGARPEAAMKAELLALSAGLIGEMGAYAPDRGVVKRVSDDLSRVLGELSDRQQRTPLPARIALAEGLGRAGDPRVPLDLLEPATVAQAWVDLPRGPGQPPLGVMRYPLTWAQLDHLATVSGHQPAAGFVAGAAAAEPVREQWRRRAREQPNHPAVMLSWDDALWLCRYLTQADWRYRYDLPTEGEWERAVRHGAPQGERRPYPWGSGLDPSFCNIGKRVGRTTPVGVYPGGTAADGQGCVDLIGNVWEWCQSEYDDDPTYVDAGEGLEDLLSMAAGGQVARGGSYQYMRAGVMRHTFPGGRSEEIGVRLVRRSR